MRGSAGFPCGVSGRRAGGIGGEGGHTRSKFSRLVFSDVLVKSIFSVHHAVSL